MMKNGASFIGAFVGGAIVGAVLGILFAPESGEETRKKVLATGNETKKKILEILKEKGIHLTKEEVDNLVDEIKSQTVTE